MHRFGYILASVRTMLVHNHTVVSIQVNILGKCTSCIRITLTNAVLEGPWLIFGVDKSLIFIANNGLCYRLLYTSYCSSSQEMSLKETESETKTSKKDW